MDLTEAIRSALLMLMLLNPFLLVVYLTDVFEKVPSRTFTVIMVRAGLVSSVVFVLFALLGEFIFTDILQAHFSSFQVFGGIIFLIIGVRFVFEGNSAIEALRGESAHVAGAVAMPLFIGPGTIGASILVGQRLSPGAATLTILAVVVICVGVIVILKQVHDFVRPRNEALLERYIEIAGRVTALIIGTFAIEMIMTGIFDWISHI